MNEDSDNTLAQVRPDESAPFATGALTEFDANEFANAPAPPSREAGPAFSASMLLRRKWWILGVFFFVASTSIPAIWVFTVPAFVAHTAVQVSARAPKFVFDTENNGLLPLYRSFLNTQVTRIKGRRVLEMTLDNPKVQATEWFHQTPRDLKTLLGAEPPSPIERLLDALEVGPRRDTELIDVSFTASRPEEARLIVNIIVDNYQKLGKNELADYDKELFSTLRTEEETRAKQIDNLVERIGESAKEIGTSDPDIVRSQVALRLSELETVRENLRQNHALTLWELEQASPGHQVEEVDASLPTSDPMFRSDADWRRLKADLLMAEHALAIARQQYGEAHPRIKELLVRIDQHDELLREREAELADPPGVANRAQMSLGRVATATGAPPASRYLANHQSKELALLDARIAALRNEQNTKGDLAKGLASDQKRLARLMDVHGAVRDRLTALEMELKAPGRISVPDQAVASNRPEKDRRIPMTAAALFGAIVAGIAAGYFRATMDTRICEASEVQQTLMAPFLGQLPHIRTGEDLLRSCTPMIIESVRLVRTALLERLDKTGRNVVLITSASSQNGKTTVAALLARSLAQLGRRTLLVEADLRRPSLGMRLNVKAEFGLGAVLSRDVDDGKAITETCVPNLDLLLAGNGTHPNQTEALANGVLGRFLDRWRNSYDFVLLDAPPVLPVADARILAGQSDGAILVLRSSRTRRAEVIQAYADLTAAGARVFGTVLVDTQSQPTYGYYGSYHAAAEEARMLDSTS